MKSVSYISINQRNRPSKDNLLYIECLLFGRYLLPSFKLECKFPMSWINGNDSKCVLELLVLDSNTIAGEWITFHAPQCVT